MYLNEILKNINYIEVVGVKKRDVSDIKIDSKKVLKGDLFICIKGRNFDGHDFISEVESYGAIVVVTEKRLPTSITQVIVKDTRIAMNEIARAFYDFPDKKLKILGVVGTNGKTTITYMIKGLFESVGVKCGVIGTLGVKFGSKNIESNLTTPDPIELFSALDKMYKNDIKVVVMEVSAHAIYYGKLNGINFEVGIFTNCTRDHLDFFNSFEEYRQTKLSFFKQNVCKYILTNVDDSLGLEISKLSSNCITYGIYSPSDVFAMEIIKSSKGTKFILNLFDCIYKVKLKLIGEFNVYNALASASAVALYGLNTDKIVEGINSLSVVSGRLEKIFDRDFSVFIDYAHTPDGLEKTIRSLKEITTNRIITVFGCGGDRDKGKRFEMGKISGELSDFSIITSDNPRFEEPMDIIFEIERGVLFKSKNYILIQDRVEAIKYAINIAEKGDVVLIAGKGCEKYQEVLGIKHLYNDKDTVKELLRG